eukprot:3228394-Pyramimonas_sp.AAC.1
MPSVDVPIADPLLMKTFLEALFRSLLNARLPALDPAGLLSDEALASVALHAAPELALDARLNRTAVVALL